MPQPNNQRNQRKPFQWHARVLMALAIGAVLVVRWPISSSC